MLFVMVQIAVRKLEDVAVCNSLYFILLIFFKILFLEDISPFCGATDTPVLCKVYSYRLHAYDPVIL